MNDFLLNFVLGSFWDCVAEGGDAQAILVQQVANLPVLSVRSGLLMLCFWISFEMRLTKLSPKLAWQYGK